MKLMYQRRNARLSYRSGYISQGKRIQGEKQSNAYSTPETTQLKRG